jgi:membrane protease YdiL (CAAX protease family)
MADWTAFAGFAGVVTALLLLLSHASREVIDTDGRVRAPEPHVAAEGIDADRVAAPATDAPTQMPTSVLLVNVAVSQGLFGVLLVGGAWYAQIPARAFGLTRFSGTSLALGVALGVALYLANELGAGLTRRAGVATGEELRALLAPSTSAGWVLLLLVVLPIIAGFEELLFRGALVGAISAGFGVSPWALAVVSSAAFALGHGAQGPGGVVVTGLLGFVLASAFVLTGSLTVVFVAHYLVNALEFVVHEGLDVDWVS